VGLAVVVDAGVLVGVLRMYAVADELKGIEEISLESAVFKEETRVFFRANEEERDEGITDYAEDDYVVVVVPGKTKGLE